MIVSKRPVMSACQFHGRRRIDDGNNNVRYCDFHDFYDSYLFPEAVASLEASAASSEASSDSTDGGSVSAE